MRDFLENRTDIAAVAKPKAQAPAAFKPPTLPQTSLASGLANAAATVAATTTDTDFPKIELKHDAEGRIREIIVTCRCGERSTLQCTY